MTAIDNYLKYWDDWHKEWYSNALTSPPIVGKVKDWITPIDKGSNENPIWQYFPEPYWGNPLSTELTAVFLNVNPGGGGNEQNILNTTQIVSQLIDTYTINKNIYSDTIKHLSKEQYYPTTKWMFEKRISWLRKIVDNDNLNVTNVLCADLIPWHSKSKKDIIQYALNDTTAKLIMDKVISPLTEIAKTVNGFLKSKVIVRSSIILDILTKLPTNHSNKKEFVVIDESKGEFGKFNSYLTVFTINDTDFLVFSGGASMSLPNSNYSVYVVRPLNKNVENKISLKEFIKTYADK
jgi:hypothetical protein